VLVPIGVPIIIQMNKFVLCRKLTEWFADIQILANTLTNAWKIYHICHEVSVVNSTYKIENPIHFGGQK
jgi:hypothetical protein